MRSRFVRRIALVTCLAALGAAMADASYAIGRGGGGRGGGGAAMRGGGIRSSGATSIRGGGYSRGGSSMSRSGYNRSGSSGFNRSGYSRSGASGFDRSTAGSRAGSFDRAAQRPAGDRTRGGDRIQGGNRVQGGDRVARGDTIRGSGNRINTGDVNFNRNVAVDGDWDGWGGWDDHYHPIAAGVAFGTAAAVTAAAIGSTYYALPPGCPPYYYSGYTYYSCGGAYYEPRYEGSTVVYVTVPEPGSN